MRNLFCRCDLNAIQAVAGAAIVTTALFAWANGSAMFDQPDVDNVANPLWQVWQIGALVIAFAGVWPLWFGTRRVSWVRSLALGVFALTIFVNTYTGVFGDYSGEVWATVNPLFLAFFSVARASPVALRLPRPGAWEPASSSSSPSWFSSTPTSSMTEWSGASWTR